jgi:hypothetical protein
LIKLLLATTATVEAGVHRRASGSFPLCVRAAGPFRS